jgi:uncharacterized protein (DUF1800 family)
MALAGTFAAIPAARAGVAEPGRDGGRATGEDSARAVHLLSRVTWGVRPADVARIVDDGVSLWLASQLDPGGIAETGLDERLSRFPLATAGVTDLLREYGPERRPRSAIADSAGRTRRELTPADRREMAMRSPQRILADLVGAKLTRAVHAERQVEEVMADFWFNHFNVFFNKGLDRYLVGDYESRAIRPHVFGRFEDMLRATAEHPAMLFYLDNFTSAAPDSMAAASRGGAASRRQAMAMRLQAMTDSAKDALVRSGRVSREQLERMEQLMGTPLREPGINENYARELLELHTLGVDGGYTQEDVVDVARAFTGWTIDGLGRGPRGMRMGGGAAAGPRFVFRPEMHDVHEKSVLGRTLAAGRGEEDGRDVLHLLAHHPSTARYLATKLVARFVSDEGDAELVDTLAAVFLNTDGDLREVTRALFTAERFYAPEHRRSKVKTPFELVASMLRVTAAEFPTSVQLINALRAMGQLPYTESAPTGFPAVSADWVNSGAMLARMNFALDLAAGRVRGVRIDGAQLMAGGEEGTALRRLIEKVVPGVPAGPIEARVREDLAMQQDAERRTLAMRALGLVLGSPEFQRR